MGRSPCCSKEGMNKGAWTAMEDKILTDYIKLHGEGKWRKISNEAGLKRCGKSCRLRWMNYLRPDIKRGNISPDEEDLIIRLHKLLGNRWSLIAGRLPGRTDNEIKNYWNTHLSKKEQRKPKANHSKVEKKAIVISSNVIRTKASRCKEVLIYPQHIVAAESENSDGSITITPSCKEEKNLGFMVGTDADDQISVSEIFAHDFANDLGCMFEMGNLMQGDDDAAENYLSKVAEQLQQKWSTGKSYIQDDLDSDFGSLVAFLESAEEWLI